MRNCKFNAQSYFHLYGYHHAWSLSGNSAQSENLWGYA